MNENELFDEDSLDPDDENPRFFAGMCTDSDLAIFSGITIEGLIESLKLINEDLNTKQ